MTHIYQIAWLALTADIVVFALDEEGLQVIKETNEMEKDVSHRAARLYRFDKRKYDRLAKRGSSFEV